MMFDFRDAALICHGSVILGRLGWWKLDRDGQVIESGTDFNLLM